MQKKLIALAIAGLSSAAFAQTNVTLYGVADISFDSVAANSGVTSADTRNSFTRTTSNSSYVGIKGAEDLGDGLKAVFQFETGFNGDTGVYSGAGRDTYVGLAGGFGTVVLGNLTAPTRALGGRVEMLPGNTGIGDAVSLVGNIANIDSNGTTGIFDTRLSNAVAYISPNFNGFNVVAVYASGENKNLQSAANKLNSKAYDLGLNYAQGPVDFGVTYANLDSGSDLTGAVDLVKNTRVGGSYNFGVAKVSGEFNVQKVELVGGGDMQVKSFSVQGKYQLTARGSLVGGFTRAKDVTGSGSCTDCGAKMWTLGYLHDLSKRTTVKFVVARINNDENAAYDFSSGAVRGTAAAVALPGIPGSLGAGYGSNTQGIQVGVRHSF